MKCIGLSHGYTCFSSNRLGHVSVTFGSQPWSLLKRHWNPFLISDAEDRNSYGENRKYPTKGISCGSMPIMACAFVLCSEAAKTSADGSTERHGPDKEHVQSAVNGPVMTVNICMPIPRVAQWVLTWESVMVQFEFVLYRVRLPRAWRVSALL